MFLWVAFRILVYCWPSQCQSNTLAKPVQPSGTSFGCPCSDLEVSADWDCNRWHIDPTMAGCINGTCIKCMPLFTHLPNLLWSTPKSEQAGSDTYLNTVWQECIPLMLQSKYILSLVECPRNYKAVVSSIPFITLVTFSVYKCNFLTTHV